MSEPKPACYETVVEVVVYSREPIVDVPSLWNLGREIESGDWIGDWSVIPSRPIQSRDEARKLLLAIGNGGDFFDFGWELDDETVPTPAPGQSTAGL